MHQGVRRWPDPVRAPAARLQQQAALSLVQRRVESWFAGAQVLLRAYVNQRRRRSRALDPACRSIEAVPMRSFLLLVVTASLGLAVASASNATVRDEIVATNADAVSARVVYVARVSGHRDLVRRPSWMHVTSDENWKSIRWSRWGGSQAHGRGLAYGMAPTGNHTSSNPFRLTLYGRRTCGGVLVYTRWKVTYKYQDPSGARVRRYPVGCPG